MGTTVSIPVRVPAWRWVGVIEDVEVGEGMVMVRIYSETGDDAADEMDILPRSWGLLSSELDDDVDVDELGKLVDVLLVVEELLSPFGVSSIPRCDGISVKVLVRLLVLSGPVITNHGAEVKIFLSATILCSLLFAIIDAPPLLDIPASSGMV